MKPFDEAVSAMQGLGMQFAIFDRRVMLPLDQLVSSVQAEAGETVTIGDLRTLGNDGLIPLTDEGAPLYVPSRVGLLLELAREGYSSSEVRDIAESEEATIDEILTTDELAYIDDDLDLLINTCTEMVEHCSHVSRDELSPEQVEKLNNYEQFLVKLRRYKAMGLPESRKGAIADAAFEQRAKNEMIRVMMLDQDRARIRAGYSPSVCASASRYDALQDSPGLFEASVMRINWEWTIKSALARYDEVSSPRIRVPSFLLEGDRVAPTDTLTPSRYKALWEQHDLDGYLLAWSEISGERCCLNCLSVLDTDGSSARRYCGERCRNAAKQRRFRKRNPAANYENQRKYWTSLDD